MTFSTVLISDYKQYLEEQIKRYESRVTACRLNRTNAIIEYKSLPWYKKILAYNPEHPDVFNYEGDLIWIYLNKVSKLEKEMSRAEYTYDNVDKFMNIDSDNDFWDWK